MRMKIRVGHYRSSACVLLLVVTIALTSCALADESSSPPTPWYPPANAAGDPIVGVYESRVPCLDEQGQRSTGCQRLKLALVLYGQPGQPTTYLMSRVYVGSGDERLVNEGAWRIGVGTATDDRAPVYELDGNAPADLRFYWMVSQDILFVLDPNRTPRPGTAEHSYALNRTN